MVLKVYNTLTRSKEEFTPLHGNRVNMFVCGPTVYDYMHLGHARTYIAYDVIARYLRYKKYSLFYIMNITDVDDKIIERAKEKNVHPIKLAVEYENYFMEDMERLGINTVNLFVRASEHLEEIINQVKTLIEKGYAYETETGVYYDVTKFLDYGKLSRQKPEELSQHRVDPDPTKRHPQDFALWKKRSREEFGWDSPWGYGRPGWHIEDTAITVTYFGPTYDIHGGAIELIFPHHEAEIAQAEAATGVKPLVRYWVHTGLLTVRGEKMSKSLGNFITVRDALKKYDAETLRFFFILTHYRSPIDFDEQKLEQARESLRTLYNTLQNLQETEQADELTEEDKNLQTKLQQFKQKFLDAMDDDFNTPVAVSVLFELAHEVNRVIQKNKRISSKLKEDVSNLFKELGGILGILQKPIRKEAETEIVDKLLEVIIEVRNELRNRKEYEIADRIRNRLREVGIVLEDTGKGTRWRFS